MKDTSLFMAYARGELTFAEYIAAEDAVDPVDGSHASAVAPAPLWWLGVARMNDARRDAQLDAVLATKPSVITTHLEAA